MGRTQLLLQVLVAVQGLVQMVPCEGLVPHDIYLLEAPLTWLHLQVGLHTCGTHLLKFIEPQLQQKLRPLIHLCILGQEQDSASRCRITAQARTSLEWLNFTRGHEG